MRRSKAQLVDLAAALSPRRRQLIETVATFRLITGQQLQRIVDPPGTERPASRARLLRYDLKALTALGCLHPLERKIGGVRGGSGGQVYALGAAGLRLIQFWGGQGMRAARPAFEPSIGFQDHALAVTECVVATIEAARRIGRGAEYRIEQQAWRTHLGARGESSTLKPDAELVLQDGGYYDHWWIEIDRGTERRPALRRQLSAYGAYYRSGQEHRQRGVFPLVAWLTTTPERAATISEVIAGLPADVQPLFRVGLMADGPDLLLGGGQ